MVTSILHTRNDVTTIIVKINIASRPRTGNGRSTNCKSLAGFLEKTSRAAFAITTGLPSTRFEL